MSKIKEEKLDAPPPVLRHSNLEDDAQGFTFHFLKKLTPRSKEACGRLGINPLELAVRPFDDFVEQGLSAEIQKLRFQEYEQFRKESITMARKQRHQLVQTGWGEQRPRTGGQRPASSKGTGVLPSLTQEDLEQRRLDKVMKRQTKELEQMVAYELKMAELAAKQEQKLQCRQDKEAKDREATRLEKLKLVEKQRLWQITKLEKEENEKKNNKNQAKKMHQQHERFLREQQLQVLAREEEARKNHEKRMLKKQELGARTLSIQKKQEDAADKKQLRDKRREELRQGRLANEKKAKQEAAAEKAKLAKERVQAVRDMNDQQLEDKRNNFTHHLKKQKERMQNFAEQQFQNQLSKIEQKQAKESLRQKSLAETKAKQIERNRQLKQKERENAILRHKQRLHDQEQAEFKAELVRLSRHRKEVNLNRIKQQEEYHRRALAQKIEAEAQRAHEKVMAHEKLIQERQAAQIAIMKQKKELVHAFETVKKQGASGLQKLDLSKSVSMIALGSPKAKVLHHSSTSKTLR